MSVTGFRASEKSTAVEISGSYKEIAMVDNTWSLIRLDVEPSKTGVLRARIKLESSYPANWVKAMPISEFEGEQKNACGLSGNCFVQQVGEGAAKMDVAAFGDNPIELRLDWAGRTLTMEYKGQDKPIVFANLREDCVPCVKFFKGKVTSLPLSAAQKKEADEEEVKAAAVAEAEKIASEKAAVEKAVAEKAECLSSFLTQAGLEAQKAIFLENGFDELQMLLVMSEEDMKAIGLKIGHIRKLQAAQIAAASAGGSSGGSQSVFGTPGNLALPKVPTTLAAPAQVDVKNRKHNRWGDGIEAAAAGSRDFFQSGYVPTTTAEQSIKGFVAFGYDDAKVSALTASGEQTSSLLKSVGVNVAPGHCSVVEAFTEEPGFYNDLNYVCRTPGKVTDKKLDNYRDYLYHMENALSSLESYLADTFRGTDNLMSPIAYQEGKTITWQQLSSSSKKSTQAAKFVGRSGTKLFGSMFLIHSLSGKDIEAFSAFPEEAEVLFKFNSHFLVKKKITDEATKKAMLPDLAAYDMEGLDLWELQQL